MTASLPQPTPEELAHSQRLRVAIVHEIDAQGPLDFSRYMALALYAPGLGYYSAGKTKFGAGGDFVTAPELGSLFARCMARAIAPVLRETQGDILELGAGSGALAVDMLLALQGLDSLPARYRILEISADLRERQASLLAAKAPELSHLVQWLDAPPGEPWQGALVANEVIDALPVRLFELRDDGLWARTVVHDRGELHWAQARADTELATAVDRVREGLEPWPLPYRSEVQPTLAPWLSAMTTTMRRGIAVFSDYGYPRREYYMPQRREGTLICHYRHRAHDDPLFLPGLQDLTAFVDFTAVAEAALAAGLELASYTSQAQFLIACGLPEIVQQVDSTDTLAYIRLAQQAKRLTLPGEMGERFKVMVLAREVNLDLCPAAAVDQSFRL